MNLLNALSQIKEHHLKISVTSDGHRLVVLLINDLSFYLKVKPSCAETKHLQLCKLIDCRESQIFPHSAQAHLYPF